MTGVEIQYLLGYLERIARALEGRGAGKSVDTTMKARGWVKNPSRNGAEMPYPEESNGPASPRGSVKPD